LVMVGVGGRGVREGRGLWRGGQGSCGGGCWEARVCLASRFAVGFTFLLFGEARRVGGGAVEHRRGHRAVIGHSSPLSRKRASSAEYSAWAWAMGIPFRPAP
jgi:hypothetical protein